MKAAVVQRFDAPPVYADFDDPVAGAGETVVQVHAAPLSPIVRALAAGRHYTSQASTGFIAGVDGVGTAPDGRRVYFLFPRAPFGSMAERTLVANAMLVDVPDALSDARAAAVATGGLASWVALTRRAPIQPGATVLVNGATGAAGRMAIQIAPHFGADRIVAVGRNVERLGELDVASAIALDTAADAALRAEFDRGVDVVLDFLWGAPGRRVIAAAAQTRGGRGGEPRVRYVQLGTAAGEEVPLRGDALRGSGLELLGSGIGSVAMAELLAGARELLAEAPHAGFHMPVATLPLSAVAEAWAGPGDVRYLLAPTARAA
ncbi:MULTISPECIES: quinone oxidoreductase family protein [Luteimonas]|uniref:quinone oxidoreductase family protein n=1 Tax=Luteimonas TaxID=83614 RepID=UPI000C7D770A|nr:MULTISPECIES: zinc-binding alcohol dehydrogenase family protein [Luteimonas]